MPLPGYDANAPTGSQVTQPNKTGPPSSPLDISPIRSLDDVSYVASQQLNQGNVAEGSTVPPQQNGDFRVPKPSGFGTSNAFHSGTSSFYICTWIDIDPSLADIAGYRIYAQNALQKNQQPQLVGTASMSPGVVWVPSPAVDTTITFWLQPYTTSGLTLPLSACPTGAVPLPHGFFDVSLTDPTSGDTVDLKIDNTISSGSGGSNVAGFTASDATRNAAAVFTPAFISVFGNNNLGATMALHATGSAGIVRIADGTNAGSFGNGQKVILDGGNGHAQFYGDVEIGPTATALILTEATDPGPRVASGSYLKITVAGTTFYLPLFT